MIVSLTEALKNEPIKREKLTSTLVSSPFGNLATAARAKQRMVTHAGIQNLKDAVSTQICS